MQLQRVANMAATGRSRVLLRALTNRHLPPSGATLMGPWSCMQVTFKPFFPSAASRHPLISMHLACTACSITLQFLISERLFPGSGMRAVAQKVVEHAQRARPASVNNLSRWFSACALRPLLCRPPSRGFCSMMARALLSCRYV